MKIKVNDNVQVIAGSYKGKTGKVIKTFAKDNKVVVEGINISKRHTKPRTSNDKGGIFEIEMPIHVSNVKLVDKKEAKKDVKKDVKKEVKKETKKVDAKETKKSTSTKKKASK